MDIWLWISELPNSHIQDQPQYPVSYQLTEDQPSIQLTAEQICDQNDDPSLIFSLSVEGLRHCCAKKTLWTSHACPLSADKPFLPLVLQLIHEIIDHSPTRSRIKQLKPDPVAWVLETHTPESFSYVFSLIFLTHLFWLCAFDVPAEVGTLYFDSLLSANLELLSRDNQLPVLRKFFLAVGVDAEICITRAIGYVLAKWLILREMRMGFLTQIPPDLGVSYANEAHGLWVLKGYAPVQSMKSLTSNGQNDTFMFMKPKDAALRYVLAHQQLEAVIQLGYSIEYNDDFIQVSARVDNIRIHVVQLGFNKEDNSDFNKECYFPSRIRVWMGPDSGSNYVTSLSLGRSSANVERQIEVQRVVKGRFGKTVTPKIKATTRTSTRMKMKNWRWDQDAEGNSAIYDAVLCDSGTGVEVYAMRGSDGDGFRRRYAGADRPFMKSGGFVFAGDEAGEEVKWRLNKEVEGSVLRWRIGGKVWLSYWPNNVDSTYNETRSIEWCDEVELPLFPTSK